MTKFIVILVIAALVTLSRAEQQDQTPENMIWVDCGTACPKTCQHLERSNCPEVCAKGYACKPGYVLDKRGGTKCIKESECLRNLKIFVNRHEDPNATWKICAKLPNCQDTCERRVRNCPKLCWRGYECNSGYILSKSRSVGGKCILESECRNR